MNTQQDDRIKALIAKQITDQASPEEARELGAWLAADPGNQSTFDSWKRIYELSRDSQTDLPDVDVDAEWKQFLERIDDKKTISLQPTNRWSTLLRAAAGLALLFGITFLLNYFLFNEKETVYQTADATQTVWLPDSSVVTLNNNSKLTFKSYGKATRKVALSGEAFFEVKPNKQIPFIVEVGGANVTVLGTSFNVRGYESSPSVEVVVTTGIVRLAANDEEKAVQLSPGDKGTFSKSNGFIASAPNSDMNYNAWKTKRIVFEATSLNLVAETLSQVFGTNVGLAPTVPRDCPITVTFDQQTLDAILNVLQSTLSLQYERSGDRILIVSAECE